MSMRAILVAGLLAVLLASCASTAERAADTLVKVTLTDFKYSSEVIEIPAGEKVTLELTNAGAVEHDIVIESIGFRVIVQPGKTAMRNVGPLEAGEHEVVCTIPGHKELGMVAKLIVR